MSSWLSSGRKVVDTSDRSVLLQLRNYGAWYPGCGWYWSSHSHTESLLMALVRKGLVQRVRRGYAMSNETYIAYEIKEKV